MGVLGPARPLVPSDLCGPGMGRRGFEVGPLSSRGLGGAGWLRGACPCLHLCPALLGDP